METSRVQLFTKLDAHQYISLLGAITILPSRTAVVCSSLNEISVIEAVV